MTNSNAFSPISDRTIVRSYHKLLTQLTSLEPEKNVSSEFVEASLAVVITKTPEWEFFLVGILQLCNFFVCTTIVPDDKKTSVGNSLILQNFRFV